MKYTSILFPRKVVFDNNRIFWSQKVADGSPKEIFPVDPQRVDHEKIKKLNEEKQKKLNDKEIVRK